MNTFKSFQNIIRALLQLEDRNQAHLKTSLWIFNIIFKQKNNACEMVGWLLPSCTEMCLITSQRSKGIAALL